MDENRRDQTGSRSERGESARDLVAQSMYHLVRLTRLGIQAAAQGMERLEESMARRQRERAETRPMGEAPPASRSTTPAPTTEVEPGERPEPMHRPGPQDTGQGRH